MSRTYSYDAENRQVGAAINGTGTTYSYDGEGSRITKTVSGAITTVVHDAFNHLIAEYGG